MLRRQSISGTTHHSWYCNLQCEDFEISQNTSPSMFHNVSASRALQKLIHTPQVQSQDGLLLKGSRLVLVQFSPTRGPPPASRQQFSFRKSPKLATKKSTGLVSPHAKNSRSPISNSLLRASSASVSSQGLELLQIIILSTAQWKL